MTTQVVYIILLILVFFGGRVLLDAFLNATNATKKFLIGIGLFLVYTAVLLFFLYFIYFEVFDYAGAAKTIFQHTLIGVLLMNLTTLIVAVVYFFLRSKRKMSDLDKMKLKDM